MLKLSTFVKLFSKAILIFLKMARKNGKDLKSLKENAHSQIFEHRGFGFKSLKKGGKCEKLTVTVICLPFLL